MQRASSFFASVVCLAAAAFAACGGDTLEPVGPDGGAGTAGHVTGGTGGKAGAGGGGTAGAGGAIGCPAIALNCAPKCEFGTKLDANGCQTCECNPAPTCGADACGPMNFNVVACPDGSVPKVTCGPGAAGKCQWTVGSCSPIVCPAIGCAIACPNGFVKDAKGCDTCQCAPAPVCTTDKCGPLPPVAPCPNGGGPKISCEPTREGKCAWNVGTCPICSPVMCLRACPFGSKPDANGCATCDCLPETCSADECGPGPKVATRICPDGSTAGPVCKRGKDGVCGWTITQCPSPPPNPCAKASDFKTCTATAGCKWLQPGCGDPMLPAAGCYQVKDLNCASDAACGADRRCAKRVVDPCFNPTSPVACDACASTITVCL